MFPGFDFDPAANSFEPKINAIAEATQWEQLTRWYLNFETQQNIAWDAHFALGRTGYNPETIVTTVSLNHDLIYFELWDKLEPPKLPHHTYLKFECSIEDLTEARRIVHGYVDLIYKDTYVKV